MDKIENFSQWWEKNGQYYESIGVSKEVAKAIWGAAVDTVGDVISKHFEQILKKA